MNIAKILRTTFFIEHIQWRLLDISYAMQKDKKYDASTIIKSKHKFSEELCHHMNSQETEFCLLVRRAAHFVES